MLENKQYEAQRKALYPTRLMEEAKIITGLSDYGDTGFITPMTQFLDRAVREVDFTTEGLHAFRTDGIRLLVNRLRVQEAIRQHPEILQEDVSDPIIIIGLPRSGTTKLQRMLASAPGMQKLYMWRMLNPAPFPDTVSGQRDPRMAAAGLGDIMASDNAAVGAAHEMSADNVDEEMVLFDFAWDPSVHGFCSYLPLLFYKDWAARMERKADLDTYRYMKLLLQYLQWQDGGKRGRPWVMKAIIHIAHMDALLECFPKATLVHCHRDPRNAIPSFAKMMWMVWSMKTRQVDKKFSGQELLHWGAASMNRYLEARDRLRLEGRIVDATYDAVRNDIRPLLREIYARGGWTLTPEAEQAMQLWEQNNEQGKLGEHHYSLEELGLSEDMIDQAFAEYIRRFIS